jgi:hypothetical protein
MKVKVTRTATYIVDVDESNQHSTADIAYAKLSDENWSQKPAAESITTSYVNSMDDFITSLPEEKRAAMEILQAHGQTGGGHHLAWVIDQTVRALIGTRYDEFVRIYMDGEDGPDTYSWDQGVSP